MTYQFGYEVERFSTAKSKSMRFSQQVEREMKTYAEDGDSRCELALAAIHLLKPIAEAIARSEGISQSEAMSLALRSLGNVASSVREEVVLEVKKNLHPVDYYASLLGSGNDGSRPATAIHEKPGSIPQREIYAVEDGEREEVYSEREDAVESHENAEIGDEDDPEEARLSGLEMDDGFDF